MAFTIKKRESYRWTVEHVVEVRNGKPELMSFDAEFKAIGRKRAEELLERARRLDIKDSEFLDEVLAEIHGLEGEGGKVYRRGDLDELAELYPGLITSISDAWIKSMVGGAAARKN